MTGVPIVCPRNWKTAFDPLRTVEDEQRSFFSRFVLPIHIQGIEVLEINPGNKKGPEQTCEWIVKFRHNFRTENCRGGLYDYMYSLLQTCKPINTSIHDLVALCEDTFIVTYNIKCTCECLNF